MAGGGWLDKAKDYIKGNPQQADGAIEKVEDLIDQRTGGKYADKLDQGGDLLRGKLGLPAEEAAATQPDADPDPPIGPGDSTEPPAQGDSIPAPMPQPPMPDDPQPEQPLEPADPGDPAGPTPPAEPITPGGPQQPGQPGGPLEPAERPSDPGQGTPSGTGDALPQGGSTHQGDEAPTTPTPGTPDEPDAGGPRTDAAAPEKQLPPFGS